MRWSIPTLIQVLVDQGVGAWDAGEIVAGTYPITKGDTFYRSELPHIDDGHAVGVYALYNSLRADMSPVGGVTVTDDARRIAQALRAGGRDLDEIVMTTDQDHFVISAIAAETVGAIRQGARFEPLEVPDDDHIEGRLADLSQVLRRLDGLPDYIRSIPRPNFN